MDARLYERAITWKRRRPSSEWLTPRDTGSWFRPQGYTQAEILMRSDMAANKAAWTGDVLRDLWLWTKNTNPIVALCCSHPLHPISKLERVYILLLQVLLFAYIAILLTRMDRCSSYLADHGSCSAQEEVARAVSLVPSGAPPGPPAHEPAGCCELSTQTLLRLDHALDPAAHRWWAGTFSIYLPMIGLTAAVTLLNVVLGQLWFLLAGCPCFQRSPSRNWWETVGTALLLLFGVAPLTHLTWILMRFQGHYVDAAFHFVKIKLVAVTGSTIVQTIVFIKLWNAEMNGARPARLFLTVDDMRSYEAQLDTRDEYLNLAPTAATADVGASRPDASKAAKGATACL